MESAKKMKDDGSHMTSFGRVNPHQNAADIIAQVRKTTIQKKTSK
jgi:hypothetical protein